MSSCNIISLSSGNIKLFNNVEDLKESIQDSVLNKIKKTSYSLSRIDCPNTVYEYFNKKTQGGLDTLNKKTTELVDISQWMSKLSDFVRDKEGNNNNDIIEVLCLTVNTIYKSLVDILEEILKVVPDLFRKIDELRREIESVLLNFAISIKECVLDVIYRVQKKINELFASFFDFHSIQELMEMCPCITEFFGWLFKCKNKNSSYEVISCMRDVLGLDPSGALTIINNFFNNVLKASILATYNALESAIRYIFKVLLTPIREIVKFYCEMLNKKHDVSVIINTLGGADCLLIYSIEYKNISGKIVTYKGMSVIDIINTLKMWAMCFDGICSFSDDIKLEIKRINEILRLNSIFWEDPYTIDIYQSCTLSALNAEIDPAITRNIFIKNQDATKNSLVELYDAIKIAKKTETINYIPYNNIGNTQAMVVRPDAESSTGLDIGNFKSNKILYDGVDEMLVSLVNNIKNGMPNEGYSRLLTMLKMWLYEYKKSPQLIDALSKAEYEYALKTSLGLSSNNENNISNISPYNLNITPTYKLEENKNFITFDKKPNKQLGQTLSEYYGSWYSMNV